MRTSQHKPKFPSKTQYLANIDGFIPSNLHKATRDPAASLMSTANRTFNQNASLQDTLTFHSKKISETEKTTSLRETLKPNTITRTKSIQKSVESKKKGKVPNNKKQKKALMSASLSSLRSASSQAKRESDKEESEVMEDSSKRFRESRSVSEVKENLPGNYDHPKYLYKGLFQNNYVMGDALEFRDQEINEIAVRKGYKDYDEQYNPEKRPRTSEGFQSTGGLYLEQRLTLFKLVDTENSEAKPQGRKMINISESINNSEALYNPNYMPIDITKEKLPGAMPGKRTISEREKAAVVIQKIMRGILVRQRVKKMKQTLKKHFHGDLDVDPYEIAFYDMNIAAFKRVVENEEGITKPLGNRQNTDTFKGISEEDPNKKLLSNTFASLLRTNFFLEEPTDYVVLAETRNDPEALFPKLIYEDQKAKAKEIMMYKKYSFLMEKPIVDKEIKSDNTSVIKNFLKSNLSSISEADLKVDKFKIQYKTPIKVQTKVSQPIGIKSQQFSPKHRPSKFNAPDFRLESGDKDIYTEISEDYSQDFNESAIKESINESIHMGKDNTLLGSMIKESLVKDATINESIRESYDHSPHYKFDKKLSNRSISEDIDMLESRRQDRNSYKSIQEEISESIDMSVKDTKPKGKKPKVDEDQIEEDIDFKDSYDNEKFESLEESIQESIEKFQASKRNNTSASSSPVKVEEKPIASKPWLKPAKAKEEPISVAPTKVQTTVPAQKSLQTIKERTFEVKPVEKLIVAEERKSVFEEKEERRPYMSTNIIPMPSSKNAEILFSNFQKELDKMVYMDHLTQKVHSLGNTIENLYQQKEYNLLHSIQNRGTRPPVDQQVSTVTLPPSAEGNTLTYLMQKYNTMERSMMTISNQLNFLINNFTGDNIAQANNTAAAGQRKPRPIIPVRRSQSVKVKDETALKPQKEKEPEKLQVPVQTKEKEKVQALQVPAPTQEKVQIKPQIQEKVQFKPQAQEKPKEKEPEKPVQQPVQIKDLPKEKPVERPLEKPKVIPQIEEKTKPKFTFKLPTTQKKEPSIEEIEEDIEIKLPSIVEKKPEFVIKKQEIPEFVVKKEEIAAPTPAPTAVIDSKASTNKSLKFGKWHHESSSENVSEEIVEDLEDITPMKKSEEDEDFSEKAYSESFERLSPVNASKKSLVTQRMEDIKKPLETPKSQNEAYSDSFEELSSISTNRRISPQKPETKKTTAPKPHIEEEEEIEDLVIDEDIDLPMESKKEIPTPSEKVLPKAVPAATKEIEKDEYDEDYENVDDFEEYEEEEFEALSLPSETKEEETPVKPAKIEPVTKTVAPIVKQEEIQPFEAKPKETDKSDSSDIEASQDLSVISWQGPVISAEEPEKVEIVPPKSISPERKVPAWQDFEQEKSPRRSEEEKLKLKHEYIAEYHTFDIHQDIPQAVVEKLNQSLVHDEEDAKHNQHITNIQSQVKTLAEKMTQAKKTQIIGILINHINYGDPQEKLTIFDKNPIKDDSITDAYNEILLNLFHSEFRKLNNEFATTKEVEKKMLIKLDNLMSKAKDILLKRISHTPTELEEYKSLGRNFNNIYETLRNKKMPGEENDFYEEEGDIKRLIEEENNRVKETIADQVMETLFEDLVKDLLKISDKGRKF